MKNNDFMIYGVEVPGIREMLITEILDLMDGKYQEAKWIYASEAGKHESFHSNIHFPLELFDDLNMIENIEKVPVPYNYIGWYLKTKNEAEYLYEVAKPLTYLSHHCYYNAEYLSSPELYQLREISLEAFIIFMENEKENDEFCKFIAESIKVTRCPEMILEGQDPYKLIMEYVEICRKDNQALKEVAQMREQ